MNLQLLKKLLRDLWARKTSLGALTFIGVLGISFLVAMFGVYFDLRDARDSFYSEYSLAEFRITVKAVPENLIAQLAEEPGIESLEGSVALEARVEVEDFPDPIQATMIGIPIDGKRFNKLKPVLGEGLETLRTNEAYASSAFFAEHGFASGDTVNTVILGQRERLRLIGAVQSPEWVYVLAPGGSLAPDPLRSAVLFVPMRQLQEAGELENSYNQILGSFSSEVRGHPEARKAVLERLKERLHVYGVFDSVEQDQFLSVNFLESDIVGLRVSAWVMPSLCLIIVAVVLNVVIGRIVAGQRTVIGTLKALGYPTGAITFHYLGFGIAVGLAAAVLGVALGRWLQENLLGLYRTVYELPIYESRFYPDLVFVSVGLSLGFALLGTVFGVVSATRLSPASAMRPPPPEKGGRIILERGPMALIWRRLPFSAKLILRAIFRNPFRSLVTLGSSFVATAIMVESLALGQAVTVLIDKEFRVAQRFDASISLREPLSVFELQRELELLPGVREVEGQLSVPASMRVSGNSQNPKREVVIRGFEDHPTMENPLRLSPEHVERFAESGDGLFLSRKLAEVLGVSEGSLLQVELRSGTRRTVELPVLGLVETSLGLGVYARAEALSRLIGETQVWNTVLLMVDLEQREGLVKTLSERPEVLNLTWRSDSLRQMEELLEQNMGTMLFVIIIFCGFLGFGAVLNTALVAVAEREREIGTLRVLGYTPGGVTAIFSGESLLLNFLGVVAGWGGGAALTYAITRAYDTEIFRFPFVMSFEIVLQATAIISAFLLASQLILGRLIKSMNWLEVLKIRE